jgi:hypothetical protein
MLTNNRRALADRWPEILRQLESADLSSLQLAGDDEGALMVDGRHLTSRVDAHAEAELQAAQIAADAREIWLYGPSIGLLPQQLLQRGQLQILHVVLLNLPLFTLICHHIEQPWLNDHRLRLHLGASQSSPQSPFIVQPAELELARGCDTLVDHLRLTLDSRHSQIQLAQRSQRYAQQAEDNLPRIQSDGNAAQLIARWRSAAPLARFALCGAGPSLLEGAAAIASADTIIAVDAALRPLLAAGITPHVVVSIDGERQGVLPYFSGDLTPLAASTLIYYPVVHGDILDRWPGERLTAYGPAPFYDRWRERLPRQTLWSSGSVIHPAIDLAVLAGGRQLDLHGCDFAFPRQQSHAAGSAHARTIDPAAPHLIQVQSNSAERVATLANLNGYRLDLEEYIRQHPLVTFINHSQHGAKIDGTQLAH